MGTARTSPKVVRERRRLGVQPRRGKVKRHFNPSHRNDRMLERRAHAAKAFEPTSDTLEQTSQRLAAEISGPPEIVENATQEIWVQLLEGRSEDEIREQLSRIVSSTKEMEWGPLGEVSLDAPLSADVPYGFALSDLVDDAGHDRRKKVPSPKGRKPTEWFYRKEQRRLAAELKKERLANLTIERAERERISKAQREDRKQYQHLLLHNRYQAQLENEHIRHLRAIAVQQERDRWQAEKREEQRQRYEARLAQWAALRQDRLARLEALLTCAHCGGPKRSSSASVCRSCWLRNPDLRAETRRNQSNGLRTAWQGEYGERRRIALNVAEKKCRRCGYEGDWDNFAKNPNCYGGVDSICKPCMAKQTQEYKARRRAAVLVLVQSDPGLRVVNGKVMGRKDAREARGAPAKRRPGLTARPGSIPGPSANPA